MGLNRPGIAKGIARTDQKELACADAERSGLSREESADLSRAVLEAIAGQLSGGKASGWPPNCPARVSSGSPGGTGPRAPG